MASLIEDVPEALAFCEAISANLEQHLLFPGERILAVLFGVLSTSGIDLRGEQFTPEALVDMERTIQERPIWMMAEHNPLIQPIGRIVAAKVFYSENAKMHFVAGIIGYYGHDLPNFADVGIDLDALMEQELGAGAAVHHPGAHMQLAFNPHEIDWRKVREVLQVAPELVDKTPGLRYRKGAEPIGILELALTVWLLTQNPFSKGFLERLGTNSADTVSAAAKWVWNEVIKLADSSPTIKIFEVTANFGTCRVEFVIPSRKRRDVEAALAGLGEASVSALALVKQLQEFEPDKLIYIYDIKQQCWSPKHAATRKLGVISESPVQVDTSKYKALSAGGEYKVGN